jgi:hypothetical protein
MRLQRTDTRPDLTDIAPIFFRIGCEFVEHHRKRLTGDVPRECSCMLRTCGDGGEDTHARDPRLPVTHVAAAAVVGERIDYTTRCCPKTGRRIPTFARPNGTLAAERAGHYLQSHRLGQDRTCQGRPCRAAPPRLVQHHQSWARIARGKARADQSPVPNALPRIQGLH